MTYQTLFVRVRPRVPLFKVVIGTLAGTPIGEVEVNNDMSTFIPFGILLAYLTEQDEFLRRRVGDCSEHPCTNFTVEVVFPPAHYISCKKGLGGTRLTKSSQDSSNNDSYTWPRRR